MLTNQTESQTGSGQHRRNSRAWRRSLAQGESRATWPVLKDAWMRHKWSNSERAYEKSAPRN